MSDALTIVQPRLILDDPHACTDSSDVLAIFGALFDALVRRGPSGWEGALATGWEMSDDARSTVFTLRENVRFHDGEPCDAQAVAYCLNRMARPDMGATLGAPGVYAQYLTGMTVEALGSHTLRVTTAEPIADLFDILAYGHIVSPRALEQAGDDLVKRAVGTGPYRLVSYERDDHLTAHANPEHFDGAPRHASLTFRRGATSGERLAALVSGTAQIAVGLDRQASAPLADKGFELIDHLSPTALILLFNAASGPLADRRVRLALNLAIDREALVRDVLGGAGQPLHGYVSPAHEGFDPDAPAFPVDRARARDLLAQAGFGGGLRLALYCPTRLPDEAPQLVEALARQLAELGVSFDVAFEPDRTVYANQVRLKNIRDICVFDSSPMSSFRVLCEKVDSRVRGSWWEGYRNPEIEALLDRARITVDRAQRFEIYRQIYRRLQQDPPWLYVYNHHRRVGFAGSAPAGAVREDGILDVRVV
ncbi:MAG: ABC transporter substrate-binding protein [Bosea sp. (in: a-proteobacteria)]